MSYRVTPQEEILGVSTYDSQYYTDNGHCLIHTSKESLFIPRREVEMLEWDEELKLEYKEWKNSHYIQATQMLNIYPRATTVVRELLKTAKRTGDEKKIKLYSQMLWWKKNKDSAGGVEKARQYPITDLIEFNSAGFANCLWHNEKTPSMKYYREGNRVHCFGCGKSADVITVMQELTQCSFKEALAKLS